MKTLSQFLKKLGPGFITGASDDDPSGIGTYAQTGAQFGYTQLWTALYAIPFMAAIQDMCGRIGLVTGKGLAGVIKQHYAKKILYPVVALLLITNTINIGADLGAMAVSAQLLLGLPFVVWLIAITLLTLALEIFVTYKKYVSFLKYLTLTLFVYVITAFIVRQDWPRVALATLIPSLPTTKASLMNVVAIFGTTISPYLFFWQADEEVEEEIEAGKITAMGAGTPRVTAGDMRRVRADTIIGMIFSNVIMFFIILTVASTLNANDITAIQTAAQAAQALKPLVGNYAFALFALGIIGTGLLAVPVLAGSASYAVAETLGWRSGLYRKLKHAYGFYGIITVATLVGLLVNFLNIAPFTMLYYTAILNGLCAPILLVLIMLISNNKKILGSRINGSASNILGWIITGFMALCAIALLITL